MSKSLTKRPVIRAIAAVLGALLLSSCGTLKSFRSVHDPAIDAEVDRLAAEVLAKPKNRELANRAEEKIAAIGEDPQVEILRRLDAMNITPVRVPGLLYKSIPHGGANLVVMNYLLGRELPLIETDETGEVEKNAEIIADYVREHAVDGRRIALLSASKGSADAYAALLNHPDIGPKVAFWVDVVGLLEGTPLTNEDAMGDTKQYRRIPRATLNSFSHEVRKPKSRPENFPNETLALHIAAFPYSSEITLPGRLRFSDLKAYGPNDGYLLLDAYTRAPGRVYMIRGKDHYLKLKRETAFSLLALMEIILDDLDDKSLLVNM